MTQEVNEFDGSYGDPSQNTQAEMPLAGLEITTDDSPDGSIAVGDPVSNMMDPKNVTIYANSITPVTYSSDSSIVAFDVVFSVGCIDQESGSSSTYQVVKRIGVDKMKMVNAAKLTTPVSIVEAVKEPSVKDTFGISTARFKALAGLN